MIYGFPTTTPFGNHEHFILLYQPVVFTGGVRVRFMPYAGYGQNYVLDVDGVKQGAPVYCAASVLKEIRGVFDATQSKHSLSVCPVGDWSSNDIDVSAQQDQWEYTRANRLRVSVTAQPEFFSTGDSSQLASWSLTGLTRFTNCRPWPRRPQYGVLDLTLSNSGSTRTVTLKIDGTTIASGSRSGDGSITLSGSYGVSGSVTVTYTGNVTSDAYLFARWPHSYPIHYRTSSFSGGDFPRTAEATIYDDGYLAVASLRSEALAAGTYYVVGHQKDDDGNESTNTDSGGATVTVYAPPNPPGTPQYVSGHSAATVISFTAASGSHDSYNIFDSGETGILDINSVADTHASGSGTIQHTLPSLASGTFTGTRYVVVRAVLGGVEEGNNNLLEIEYSGGTAIPPRPPAPGIGNQITTSGRTITVPVSINTVGQRVAAATVELFLFSPGSSPNYNSPSGTVAVSSAVSNIINVNVSATAGGNGDYKFAVRTKSAALYQSNNTEHYGPVRLTSAAFVAPASTSVQPGF